MRTVILLFTLAICLPASAGTYKWVDENGVTQYGDTIPPQAVNRGMTEINTKGQVVKKTEAALTPEQLRVQQTELAKQKDLSRQAEERRRRDVALLGTYTGEQEIDLARDRSTQQVDSVIRSAQERIAAAQVREKDLVKQLEFYKGKDKSGKTRVPSKELLEDIERAKSEQVVTNAAIGELQKQKAQVIARFDDDKLRFRDLKAGNAAATPRESKTERTSVSFTIDDTNRAVVSECLSQWADRTSIGGKHYAASGELAQIEDKTELVLDGRLQTKSGQFTQRRVVCPLTVDGKVDSKGVDVKKTLASLGARY
ncbi:MAG: DUF4124 domain-containing protein [Pseudomonadota bacterium]